MNNIKYQLNTHNRFLKELGLTLQQYWAFELVYLIVYPFL